MSSIAILGAQVGDEGKGSWTDYFGSLALSRIEELVAQSQLVIPVTLNDRPMLVYRFQGGPNAGHTVTIEDLILKLHQISGGIGLKGAYCLQGEGTLVNSTRLRGEITGLREKGVLVTPDNYGIASTAQMILNYHVERDQKCFVGKKEHSTTGRGIKDTASAKALHQGIRFVEFLDEELTTKILHKHVFPDDLERCEEISRSYNEDRSYLREFLVQEGEVFERPYQFFIAEGAQGFQLCMDGGLVPGTSSSNPCHPTHRPEFYVAVFKAYVSSVGLANRSFVTEIADQELQTLLRERWGEVGTSTGLDRHLGWFDGVAGRYAAQRIASNGPTGAVLSCLDRLELFTRLGIQIQIGTGYEVDDKQFSKWDVSFDRRDVLDRAKPVLESLDPWERTVERDGKTLTPNAERYVGALEDLIQMKFNYLGVGPDRAQKIERKPIPVFAIAA